MLSATTALLLFAAGFDPARCFSSPPPPVSRCTTSSSSSSAMSSTSEESSEESSPSPPSSASRPPRRQRSSSDRPRRDPPGIRSSTRASTPPFEKRRAPHQFDHTKAIARPFVKDPVDLVRAQDVNEDAPCYSLGSESELQSASVLSPGHHHLVSMSLDSLFPERPDLKLSETFSSSSMFRLSVRRAMREDVFDTTPQYANMSDKARKMLLLPDSSLQGSWNCQSLNANVTEGEAEPNSLRMTKLTAVLSTHLGPNAPTGDEFMQAIGNLCGPNPSHHWIDIVGVLHRRIPHSWHQDTGSSPNNLHTVLLGFPAEDHYDGPGVFSHNVKLTRERLADPGHPPNEPVLYPTLEVDQDYVVRPRFCRGKELLLFRDVDVLHSAPDVAYRASVMRFM